MNLWEEVNLPDDVERDSIDVKRLDAYRIADFRTVHSAAHGCEWCQCVAWWTPSWDGWPERTLEQNRSLREALFARGEFDGYLLYEGGHPVGWCQVGAAERLAKLCRTYRISPDPGTVAISCFLLAPGARGRGLAHALLRGVLDDLSARGCTHVLAFPRRGSGLPADDVWTGPEQLYLHAGFRVSRSDAAHPILEWTPQ